MCSYTTRVLKDLLSILRSFRAEVPFSMLYLTEGLLISKKTISLFHKKFSINCLSTVSGSFSTANTSPASLDRLLQCVEVTLEKRVIFNISFNKIQIPLLYPIQLDWLLFLMCTLVHSNCFYHKTDNLKPTSNEEKDSSVREEERRYK